MSAIMNERILWRCRVGIAAMMVVSMMFVLGCSVKLHEDLTEEQVNEALVVLLEHGIDAKKVRKGNGKDKSYEIWVSKMSAGEAWKIMQENNLPSRVETGIAEVYGKGSIVPTAAEEKALYLRALQGELIKTLKSIDGVVNARVHVVMPDDAFFNDDITRVLPKASVFLKYRLRDNGSIPFKENEIRSLIAGAIKGLQESNVDVVMQPVKASVSFAEDKYEKIGLIKISKDTVLQFKLMILLIFVLFVSLLLIIGIQVFQMNKLKSRLAILDREPKKGLTRSFNKGDQI